MGLGIIGKYEKLDVLGHGASGIVYLAWDRLLGKHVALKEISIQGADEARFLEEARVLDRLRHPNIVRVNGVDKIEGRLIIDMEYVKGANLQEYMRRNGQLPLREALSIAVQISDALDFAHKHNIVHRDVKPANVLLSEEGEAKIVDFGLAEILSSQSYAGGAGTYAYMAPEDFEEEQRSDSRSDIWAVGVTLCEMLTGKRPFQSAKAKDPFSWKRTIQEDEPPTINNIDHHSKLELERIIASALAKDKHDRYQSAGELRDDLLEILTSAGGEILPEVTTGRIEEPAPRKIPVIPELSQTSDIRFGLSPKEVDFCKVRKGESSREDLVVRVSGVNRPKGRVASQPGWIDVSPQAFSRRKQKLTVTANTESIWQAGFYQDNLTLEVNGEQVDVPVRVNVLQARRKFHEVGWWYLPLLIFSVLPLIARILSGGEVDTTVLATMGLLSMMLFIIALGADLGMLEKIMPLGVGAVGIGAVAGMFIKIANQEAAVEPMEIVQVVIAGIFLGLLIAFQLMTASKWRMWAFFLPICSACVVLVLMRL